jgi:phage terminase large subunit-like protein
MLTPSGDNFVDYHDCFDWFRMMIEEYEIYPLQVGYDRYSAQYLIQDMKAYGFHCDDVYQGDNLWPVIQETEGLMKDGRVHIGDNDLLKIHLLNSAVKMSTERGRGRLVKLSPSDHIDGTAALLDAMCVRQKWYGEIGEQLRN